MIRVSEEDVGSLDSCGETLSSGPRGQIALGFPEKSMLIRNNRDSVLSEGDLGIVTLIWVQLCFPQGLQAKGYTGPQRKGGEDIKSRGLAMLPLSPPQIQFSCLYLEKVVPNPSYILLSPFRKLPSSGALV